MSLKCHVCLTKECIYQCGSVGVIGLYVLSQNCLQMLRLLNGSETETLYFPV